MRKFAKNHAGKLTLLGIAGLLGATYSSLTNIHSMNEVGMEFRKSSAVLREVDSLDLKITDVEDKLYSQENSMLRSSFQSFLAKKEELISSPTYSVEREFLFDRTRPYAKAALISIAAGLLSGFPFWLGTWGYGSRKEERDGKAYYLRIVPE